MNVLEIKNNLVKIAYETEDNLALSSFVIIEDTNNPYVGQVMNVKADAAGNFAIVKLLFTFNEEGILKNYNGTIPSLKANVSVLPAGELLDVIPADNPISLGLLAQQNTNLKIDKSILENNLLICSNNFENTVVLLENITGQLDEKTVIIDADGQFDIDSKIVFGRDFKLPLNYDTINFIYDNDLEDVDAVSKAVIQDIFMEVQQYTKTLPEGYLPFDTFLNVVDTQYKETQIPQLVLLKNKLLKYKELNVFAQDLKDVLNLSIAVEKISPAVIDISEMPANLQKELISYIYKVLNGISETIYLFVKICNENSDKKLLKTLTANTNVYTTIICPHEYKYLNELKEISQNIILFTPLTLQHDFASYNTYLNKLNPEEFIIYGAHTQNIPFIVELGELSEEETAEEPQKIEEPVDDETSAEIPEEQITVPFETFEEPDEDLTAVSFENSIEEQTEQDEQDFQDETFEEPVEEEFPAAAYPDVTLEEQEPSIVEETNELSDNEPEIENILADEPAPVINEEIVEEEPVIEPIEEEPVIENILEEDYSQEDMVEQAAKDIDKVFYEKLPQEDELLEEPAVENFDEELTEDDLNLIDDLASDEITLAAEELPEIEENEQPPVVPIYPAEDIEDADGLEFQPGDRVSTAKYGEGVVEKMIKYGNKMLCSIDFPNIGRRLLDPAMTEITKLS